MNKQFRIILVLVIILQTIILLPNSVLATPSNQIVLGLEANEYSSCPFLYTFDGSKFVVENDLISVGRKKINEYTDYLYLNNQVNQTDGVIKFQIREVQGEKSSLDLLKLTRINHPVGTKAGVDDKGQAHTYITPSAPIRATSGSNDVLDQLSADDLSGTLLYDNQSIELAFSPADLANGAKLVLKVHGFQHDESIPESISPKVPTILIQTPDGSGGWITRSKFFPKQFAAYGVFDLQGCIDGSNPQVRLLSVSCNQRVSHLIDYAGFDHSIDQVSVADLALNSASKNGVDNILGLVKISDGNYVQLSGKAGDYIDLSYTATETTEGINDYFFTSKGYYEPEGNTFYIDTMDNSATWTNRQQTSYFLTPAMTSVDGVEEYDLSSYVSSHFANSDGTYQVKIRNIMFAGAYGAGYAYIDQVYLKINGTLCSMKSAVTDEAVPVNVMSMVSASDNNKFTAMNKSIIVTFNSPPDTTAPSVTINQAQGQVDPTTNPLVNFTAKFSEPVIGFDSDDVSISGTAGATTVTVTDSGDHITYNVAVSGMSSIGSVIASIAAGVTEDAAGNKNNASTATDNTVILNGFTVEFKSGTNGTLNGQSSFANILSGTEWSTAVVVPTLQANQGYRFNSWDKTFSEKVTGNETYTALWAINQYTATFDTNGGSTVDRQTCDFGSKLIKPSDPIRAGHIFKGWYSDETLTQAWNFDTNTVGSNDFTLYARWISLSITPNDIPSGVTSSGIAANINIPELTEPETQSVHVALKVDEIAFAAQPNFLIAADALDAQSKEILKLFDISLLKTTITQNGIQTVTRLPNSDIIREITILLPVPPEYSERTGLQVYYVNDLGELAFYASTLVTVDGVQYLEFKTDHFSAFAIVANQLANIPVTGEDYSYLSILLICMAAALLTAKRILICKQIQTDK